MHILPLDSAKDREEFRELASELRLIELARGQYGGQLRQAAYLRLARKPAEVELPLEALLAVAEKELDNLATEAETRETKAAAALQDLLGVAHRPSPLTERVESAKARFGSLQTESSRQCAASLWIGRRPEFLEWLP